MCAIEGCFILPSFGIKLMLIIIIFGFNVHMPVNLSQIDTHQLVFEIFEIFEIFCCFKSIAFWKIDLNLKNDQSKIDY